VPELPIVDSHVHLWDPSRFRMPWIDDEPRLNRPFGLGDLADDAEDIQIDQVVYVQVDATPAYGLLEAEWVETLSPQVGAIVAYAPVEDGAVLKTYLDALMAGSRRVRGVRRLLQQEPDLDFLVEPLFLTGLRLLPRYELSFDICVRHVHMARVVDMVTACPDTRFVLDHIGKPSIRSHMLDPWRAHVSALAQLENVVCKVSGVVTEADHAAWTLDDVRPYVAHVLAEFGEDRVMFGGDWPVVRLASSYRRWIETVDELTREMAEGAKRKLWVDNARRVYRLDGKG
jgi:L-fuconolactonase